MALTSATRAGAAAPEYKARIFQYAQTKVPGFLFPEQGMARYSAAAGQWGVAFSGGGSRAFAAAVGQMRGLRAAGVLDDIGAISCVSGASWFGAPFTFAPQTYSDATLLGPLVAPETITGESANEVAKGSLASLVQNLSDGNLRTLLRQLLIEVVEFRLPLNKVYARALNAAFLEPLQLGSTSMPFTLDQRSLRAIQSRNTGLPAFYTARSGRPFFIAGGTQVYQSGALEQTPVRTVDSRVQTFHNVEYTPLYVGATPLDKHQDGGHPFGGGFVESFAFDTPKPRALSNDVVSVRQGRYPFLLSDVIGSSSAAVSYQAVRYVDNPLIFPEFDYWPIYDITSEPAKRYAFSDGGTLDDTGVISLLRRGYKTIFAFVNSGFKLGSQDDECVEGVDGEVSRLFGHIPKNNQNKTQSNRVFESDKYRSVVDGLKLAQAEGRPPVYVDHFNVVDDNAFGIVPYAPRIFWIYNDRIEEWFDRLKPHTRQLIRDLDPDLKDFPHYKTEGQDGRFDPLYLTPRQVNLLADMWGYTVQRGFANFGYAFGHPVR